VVEDGSPLAINRIGTSSVPTCMSFIAPDQLFVGSHLGESSILKLLDFPDKTSSDLVKHEKSLENLAPLLDFEICDLEKRGQSLMYACSGAYKSGKIKVIGQGVGVLDMLDSKGLTHGVGGMWEVGRKATEMIVFGYYRDTRFVEVNGGTMREVDGSAIGFEVNETCLFVGDVDGGVVQVTEGKVLIVSGRQRSGEWDCGVRICHASVCGMYVLVAVDGGVLWLLKIGANGIEPAGSCNVESEVSCVSIHERNGMFLAAVGLWDVSVRVFDVPGLDEKFKTVLDGDIVCHSILLETFEDKVFLFAAQGDGMLTSFSVVEDGKLEGGKRVALGSKSIGLNSLGTSVFVASDRPTIVSARNGVLVYSSVFLPEVRNVVRIRGIAGEGVVGIDTDGDFKCVRIDEVRKLHVRDVPLDGEMAFRIAWQEASKSFGIITTKDGGGSWFRVLDQQSLKGLCVGINVVVIDSFEMGAGESVLCVKSVMIEVDWYYVVGTSISSVPNAGDAANNIPPEEDREVRWLVLMGREGLLC
jgi:DNA damage-binding protein 1